MHDLAHVDPDTYDPVVEASTALDGQGGHDADALSSTTRALALQLEEFHAYYAMTPAIMHSIDSEGRIADVSDLWLKRFGYAREEVVGRPSIELLTERSRRYAREVALPAFWRAGRCERVPCEFIARDGSAVEVELSAQQVEIGGRRFSLAVLEDVSERNAAARRLQEANDALRQFAGLASHDLRGPLGKIARLSDWLRRDMDGVETEDRLHMLGRIGDTARDMSALVDAILDLSIGVENVDSSGEAPLDQVIDAALGDLAIDIESSGARVDVRLPDMGEAPALRGDARLLRHLFANLVGNALSHSGASALTVTIAARIEGANWRIEVSDNGRGIPPDVAARLFQDRVRTEGGGSGVGVGMLLARRIVDGHGGAITLAPSSETGGACFVVTLPTRAQPAR